MTSLPLLRETRFLLPTNMTKAYRALFFAGLAACFCAWPALAHAADASATKATDSKSSKTANSKSSGEGDTAKTLPGSSYQTSNYVLRPTDIIFVNVIDDPKANGEFTIGVDGTVGLTYLDPDKPLNVQGLTVAEATKLISRAYVDQKIFIKPTINVTIKTYAERRINVMGAVSSPGLVIIPPEQTLSLVSAIAQAHGPTPRAAATVTITRKMPDGTTKTYDNVDLYKATKGTGPDFPLQEGDTIMLGESPFANVWQ